jgi:hypothetical protein
VQGSPSVYARLRGALSRQILHAKRDTNTCHEQMLVLQQVVKDMEEIREEVKVSGRLYETSPVE